MQLLKLASVTAITLYSLYAYPCFGQVSGPSLKTAFQQDFLIGTALNGRQISERNEKETQLIIREYNAITPENVMKSGPIHPEPNLFNFEASDRYVAFGVKHGMYIVGHTLIWHSQLPSYVQHIRNADSLSHFMKGHIETVAGRYAGKIKSWDVLNEALEEDGSLRKSIFLQLLGEDYIAKAFEWAAQADPGAELYYNDYGIERPEKRKGAIKLIKSLQAKGLRIDGVGIQGHWGLNGNNLYDIENSIIEFSRLGIKVAFTELDISVLPHPSGVTTADISQNYAQDPKMNPYREGLPQAIQMAQAKRYEDIFKIFIKHKEKISRVTFWGAHDGQSWLNGWPIKNRTNYPLLHDRDLMPKPAYTSILNLKTK
ncbi:endo-1,4-beta-xylanase [Dyadobacter tibetensis]|uniref:endo-1,4-beta-xylanase n=1 Tax=Dyadobacter tibetensis TaxID=1211851 RepID=UPI000471BA5C|nr:endo-1,4-beta-xylanase [Dyadobacter tibetensis]